MYKQNTKCKHGSWLLFLWQVVLAISRYFDQRFYSVFTQLISKTRTNKLSIMWLADSWGFCANEIHLYCLVVIIIFFFEGILHFGVYLGIDRHKICPFNEQICFCIISKTVFLGHFWRRLQCLQRLARKRPFSLVAVPSTPPPISLTKMEACRLENSIIRYNAISVFYSPLDMIFF